MILPPQPHVAHSVISHLSPYTSPVHDTPTSAPYTLPVGPEAVSAANQGNMEDFVKALQNTSINTSGSDPSQPEKRRKTEDKKKDDDDEDMALD
ncbi:hypothetical protein J6590_015181 [Homalodisca vitripennis]|nr:hypothetical protein J6590_015181 [Homalodisca vitripennis]